MEEPLAAADKSFGLLLECLRHTNNPRFGAVLFRQSFTQIVEEGALWDSSEEIYPLVGGYPRKSAMEWLFPSGAKVGFAHLGHENDKFKYQGSQIPLLCLQEDSLIVMGDGSTRKLRDISVGDKVKTLEGPRRVVWKGNRRKENCVQAHIWDAQKRYLGNHIQSQTHKVLTSTGWQSFADIVYASHPSWFSSSIQCHSCRRCVSQSSLKSHTDGQFLDNHSCDQAQAGELSRPPQGHQCESGFCACGEPKQEENGCVRFAGSSQGVRPPVLRNVPVRLCEPFPPSAFLSEFLPVNFGDEPCVHFWSLPPNFQGNYLKDCNLYDEQVHLCEENAQGHLQQLGDAAEHSPKNYFSDDWDLAHKYTQTPQLYVHPYRKDVRRASVLLQDGSCDFIPCGQHWVIDLTIADVSHYCTPNGLVNQNCFDELTHFSESAFFYMLSRNRSTSGVRPYMRGTTNPDADSWIAKYIDWWIDTEGFPIPERSGVVRWFIRKSGELIWADDPDTLRDRYGIAPKSFTFVASNIYDNKILLSKDPDYLSNLQALHPIDQARLLGGNWKIKPESGKVFNRTWFEIVDAVPEGGITVRFWDLAATEKTTACFTSGTKMRYFPPSDGWYGDTFFVMDNIMEQIGPASGDDLIIKTASQDGRICKVRWELEGGSSGIRDEAHLKKLLQGFDAKGIAPMGDKVKRAKPFATDSYHGKVKLLRGAWNDSYLSYLQDFPDGPVKDPIDSSSGAHAALTDPTGPKARIGKYRT